MTCVQLFLEEERERELEALLDAEQPNNEQFDLTARETGEQPETGAVSKTTAETLTAGERIMEALALSDADRAAFAEPAVSRPARAPQLAASGDPAELYVLKMVQRIPPATLQDALLVLSFSQVGSLLYHLDHWIQKVRSFARP